MTWFKVDDSFYDHPKVFDAPDCAVALWVRAGTWSARNLTDGFVPTGMPARFCDDHETAVKELLRRGLWSRSSGGYRFHDWAEYQPTRQEAMAGREKMASGGALGNHRRWHVDKGRSDPSCRYCQGEHDRVGHRVPDRGGEGVPESPPSPPGPSRPVPTGGTGSNLSHPGATKIQEPPSKCPKHIDDPEPPPCGPCGAARRAHDSWVLAEVQRRANAPKCRTHRGQLAHNCALCRAERLGTPDLEGAPA